MNNKHEKTKKILKIVGVIALVCGVGLVVSGVICLSVIGNPALFALSVVGVFLVGVGAMLLQLGFRREITRYVKNESVPVINEAAEELSPAVHSAVKAAKGANGNVCPACGKANQPENDFCDGCGKQLFVKCPHCGARQEATDSFCGACGKPLQ